MPLIATLGIRFKHAQARASSAYNAQPQHAAHMPRLHSGAWLLSPLHTCAVQLPTTQHQVFSPLANRADAHGPNCSQAVQMRCCQGAFICVAPWPLSVPGAPSLPQHPPPQAEDYAPAHSPPHAPGRGAGHGAQHPPPHQTVEGRTEFGVCVCVLGGGGVT